MMIIQQQRFNGVYMQWPVHTTTPIAIAKVLGYLSPLNLESRSGSLAFQRRGKTSAISHTQDFSSHHIILKTPILNYLIG